MTMERRESTTELLSKVLPESVPGFLGYECVKHVAGERAAHVFLRKRT